MGELLKTLKEQNSSELIAKWENIGFLSNTKNKSSYMDINSTNGFGINYIMFYLLSN